MENKKDQTEFLLNLVGKKRSNPIYAILILVILIILYFYPDRRKIIPDFSIIILFILGVITLIFRFYPKKDSPIVSQIQDLFERNDIETNLGTESIIKKLKKISDINSSFSNEDKKLARNVLQLFLDDNK